MIQEASHQMMHYQAMQGEFLSSPLNIRDANRSAKVTNQTLFVPVISKTAHPPPRANPGAFDFVKNFGHIPRYVASLDGQMPHPLELQRWSNRLFKCTYSVINNYCLLDVSYASAYIFRSDR